MAQLEIWFSDKPNLIFMESPSNEGEVVEFSDRV